MAHVTEMLSCVLLVRCAARRATMDCIVKGEEAGRMLVGGGVGLGQPR